MEELLNALCTPSLKKVFLTKKEDFKNAALKDWLALLKESRLESNVMDVVSVEMFLQKFKELQGLEDL